MTILAGIVARHEGVCITDTHCESIKHSISRYSNDRLWEFRDSKTFLAKIDIGAYGAPGVFVGKNGSISLLAGDPLLHTNKQPPVSNRMRDLQRLQQKWNEGAWEIGRISRGVFCAVHYEPTEGKVSFIADKLGLRPIYYWISKDYVVFATALRILEELSIVEKVMDIRGVTEMASFGFPLSNRTPYSRIFSLKAAEILQVSREGIQSSRYWRWDKLQSLNLATNDLMSEAFARFDEAIAIRQGNDDTTISFLSGGLDSRCIVGVLSSKNVNIHTFTIYHDVLTQDRTFASEFAKKAKTLHNEIKIPFAQWTADFAKQVNDAWNTSKYRHAYPAERPQLVWSGDGGSVSVGHVYLNRQIVEMMRSGKVDVAIDTYINQQKIGIPKKLFNRKIADTMTMIPRLGITEELKGISCEDPGRQFHLFLMLNDQRRHLSKHFEDIDLHRMEFHLPFFDGHFLELILASPIDLFLEHGFYNAWLSRFPSGVIAVPWQTYPGHARCPLPIPKNLAYQWSKMSRRKFKRGYQCSLIRQTVSLLRADDFPNEIIKKVPLMFATLLTRMYLRDYDYVMKTALTFYDYWKRCNGKYILRDNESESGLFYMK